MADVQTEHGYTKIANELLDAIIAIRIPGEVRRVFDFILRKTYGYKKKTFETTQHEMAKALKTTQPRIASALKWLTKSKMIINTKNCIVLSRNCKTILGIQKDFEKWVNDTEKRINTEKCIVNNTEKRIHTLLKKKEKGVKNKSLKKRIVYIPPTGEQLKSNGRPWINENSWNDFVQHRIEIKKPLTELAVKKSLDLLSQFKSSHSEIIDNSIRNGWTGLFKPKGSFNQQPQQEVKYNTPDEDRAKWKI